MNTFNLELDLDKRSAHSTSEGRPYVIMRQGDKLGTQIVAELFDHGQKLSTSGLTAFFVMELPDKLHYYRTSATYSSGTVTVSMDETIAASVAGTTEVAYFELHQGTTIIASTASITVVVLPSGTAGKAEGREYDDEIVATIRAWLDDHPEATTTVEDKAISTAKLADLAVTTPKLADTSVTEDKLADESVTAGKLADAAVTTDKIAGSSVTTAKLDNLSVTEAKLATDAVTNDKVANGAIGTSELAGLSVTTPKIANGAVTSDKLDPDIFTVVTDAQIAAMFD